MDALMERLRGAQPVLQSLLTTGTLPERPMVEAVTGGLTPAMRDAAQKASEILKRILGGEFSPVREELAKLSDEEFRAKVQEVADQLLEAGLTVNDALRALAQEREDVLASLTAQAKSIQDVLDEFGRIQREGDLADAREEVRRALAKLTGEAETVVAPTVEQVADLAKLVLGRIGIQDLGALSPDRFAEVLRQNLTTLDGWANTAEDLLSRAAEGFQAELDAIDAEIRRIDDRLQRRLEQLQAELDAIDREEREDERAKEDQEYLEQRNRLLAERAFLMLDPERNMFAIAAIDKQLAELEEKRAEELRRRAREDRREQIREEMEEARRQAEEEKERLERRRQQLLEQQRAINALLQALENLIRQEQQAQVDLAEGSIRAIEALKEQKSQTYNTLQEILGDIKQFSADDLALWDGISKQRVEAVRKGFDDEKEGLRKAMKDGLINTLVDISSFEDDFKAKGEAFINKLIEGIRAGKGELSKAVREVQEILDDISGGSGGTSGATGTAAAMLSIGATPMASGAFVKGGRGGVLALVGEGQHDEVVLPVMKSVPLLSAALADAIRQLQARAASMNNIDFASLGRALGQAAWSHGTRIAEFHNTVIVDGEVVAKQVRKVLVDTFEPVRQTLRAK